MQTSGSCLILTLLLTVRGVFNLELSESPNRIECVRSRIDNNVTLVNGFSSGKFNKQGKGHRITMPQCLAKCCEMPTCDVALMTNHVCYSVVCKSLEACAPSANTRADIKTSVSFVARPLLSERQGNRKSDDLGEPEVKEELQAEMTLPHSSSDLELTQQYEVQPKTANLHQRTKREWKDLILAVGCATVAVTMGVAGVIFMTRRLVDDDSDPYDKYDKY